MYVKRLMCLSDKVDRLHQILNSRHWYHYSFHTTTNFGDTGDFYMGTYFENRLGHVPSLRCSRFFSFPSRIPKRLPNSSFVLQKVQVQILARRQDNLIEAIRGFSRFLHASTWTETPIREGLLPSTFLPHFNPPFTPPINFKRGT